MARYICVDLLASESVARLKEKMTKLVEYHRDDIYESLGNVPWLAKRTNVGLLTQNVPRKLLVEAEHILDLIDELPDKPDSPIVFEKTNFVVSAVRDHIRQVFLLHLRVVRELELGKLNGSITDNDVEDTEVDIEYWESHLRNLEYQVFELEDFVMFFAGWRDNICVLPKKRMIHNL